MSTCTWTGAVDNDLSNTLNWVNGTPDATKDAVIATGALVQTTADFAAKSINFTGFTGTLDQSTHYHKIVLSGNLTLAAGMSFTDDFVYFEWAASGTFTRAGAVCDDLEVGADTGATLTISVDTEIAAINGNGVSGGTVAIGTNTISGLRDAIFDHAGALTWSTGARLLCRIRQGSSGTIGADTSITLPPVVVTCPDTIHDEAFQIWNGVDLLTTPPITSLTVTDVTMHGNAPLHVVGDFIGLRAPITVDSLIVGGNFTDVDFHLDVYSATIGGNFSATGGEFMLTPGAITVTGTAVAVGCVISGSNFSGGTELNATNGCTDGLSNTKVRFVDVVEPAATLNVPGTVMKLALTSSDEGVVFDAQPKTTVYRLKCASAWTYHGPAGSDWPITAARTIRITIPAGQPFSFYARTATTATLFVMRER